MAEKTASETGVLRGHEGPVLCVSLSVDGLRGLSGSYDNTVRMWELAGMLRAGRRAGKSELYTNAKVVLVGETSVGKTCLARAMLGERFEPQESTHGRHVWTIAKGRSGGEEREVFLWDLAGQPGYRLIHRLHLHDVAVAVVMFDARSETEPFAGVDYWARALDQAKGQGGAPKILVMGKADRGGLSVSKERVDELMGRLGFGGIHETSAQTGMGVEELKKAVLEAIPWGELPVVQTPEVFARIKGFLKGEKEKGRILVGHGDLLAAYVAAQPEDAGEDKAFETCLGLLEAAGLIRQLSFDDLVLLQPEMLDGYCASLAIAAKKEPDGLGYFPEARALLGGFEIDRKQRIGDGAMEKAMLLATVEEAVGRGVAVRESTPDGVMIVFPSELRKDFPEYPGGRALAVAFTFDGPVSAVYATLAVSLIHSVSFTKRELYKNAAVFAGPRGGECGFAAEYPDRYNDARGRLTVFFDEKAKDDCRLLFLRYVSRELEKLALKGSVKRERIYQCPDDGFVVSAESVERRRARGETTVICSDCGAHIPMDDLVEQTGKADKRVEEIEATAEEQREIQQRVVVLQRREESGEYHTFLCHNSGDKAAVRELRERLGEWGIVSWIDEKGLMGGDRFVPELEKVIERAPTALVVVGPKRLGIWQKLEYEALLDRAVSESEGKGRGLRLIPVLIHGAGREDLPRFLRGFQYYSYRGDGGTEDREAMRGMVRAILGRP